MYDQASFEIRFLNDIKKVYGESRIEDFKLYLIEDGMEMALDLEQCYKEYRLVQDYSRIVQIYKKVISDMLLENKFSISNYKDCIYPFIKDENFGGKIKDDLHSEDFFLDLRLFYVVDYNIETFRFLRKVDIGDMENIRDIAIHNINKISSKLVRLDEGLDIYTISFNNPFSSSLLLNKSILKQIKKLFNDKYLFVIPNNATLLIAALNPRNIEILRELISTESGQQLISNKVYSVKGNSVAYAEKVKRIK